MAEANAQTRRDAAAQTPPMMGGAGRAGFGGGRERAVVKPKNLLGTLKRMSLFLGKERKTVSFIFLFILLHSGMTLLIPYLIGVGVDAMPGPDSAFNLGLLQIVIVVMIAAYLADGLSLFFQGFLMANVSQRVVANLRSSLFAKLQKLPVLFFDSRPHGEVMSRLTNDIDNVSNSISQTVIQLMAGTIAIAGSLVMMLILSPILTAGTLITVPLVYILVRVITKRTGALFREQQSQLGQLNGHIEETISGIQVVKAFNHEEKAIDEFNVVNERLFKAGLKAQIYSGFLMPIMGVINNIGFAAVAIVGGVLALNGDISNGIIASFLIYSRQFVRPLNELANVYNVMLSGVAGAERVFEIIDEDEETEDRPGEIYELENPRGHVVFENVSFGYRPDVPILKNVSFESRAGSSTALVGPTGAGKTTIVNLLTRFYDVTEGRILIDGRDIKEYSRDSLRRCFGIVLQDTYLFSGTIMENITYGRTEAAEDEVVAAAKLANAHPFISRLPDQYETMLTENGGNLSQGQKQLLAVARVVLAKPSILILDEATSSIDTRTELHIQDALLQMMRNRTSFIIAHRLNTIRDADTIMVIDQGEIVEQGSHAQLMEREGRYHQMMR